MRLEEITKTADALTNAERGQLASRLLHDLEAPVYQISDKEVAARVEEGNADDTTLLSLNEFVAGFHRRGD